MAAVTLNALMPMGTVIIIIAIGIAYVAFSTFAQRKVGNPKKMRELQQRMNALSKELNQLVKSNATKEEIAKKQSELMPLMSENMKTSIKPMLVILPVFFRVYDHVKYRPVVKVYSVYALYAPYFALVLF